MEQYIAPIMPRHKQYTISKRSKLPYFAVKVLYIRLSGLRPVLAQYFDIVIDLMCLYAAVLVLFWDSSRKYSNTGSLPFLSL